MAAVPSKDKSRQSLNNIKPSLSLRETKAKLFFVPSSNLDSVPPPYEAPSSAPNLLP